MKRYILSPPPNVTGSFHLGHYLNLNLIFFLQEVLKTMNYEVIVVSGGDHAGVSAENKVDPFKELSERALRLRLRKVSIERIYHFKAQLEFGGIFGEGEIKPIFSLQQDFENKVLEIFSDLSKVSMVSQREVFVNVDTVNGKSLADEEVKIVNEEKTLYTLLFKSTEKEGEDLKVATTMPLTVFSDVALCINSEDQRYLNLVGKEFLVPGSLQRIKLYSHPSIDPTYGTGIIKVTPSMDQNDFALSLELNLPLGEACIDSKGLFSFPNQHQGKPGEDVEKVFLEEIERSGLCSKKEKVSGKTKRFYSRRVLDVRRTETVLDLKSLVDLIEIEKLNVHPKGVLQDIKSGIKKSHDGCLSRDVRGGTKLPNSSKVLDTGFNASVWPLILDKSFDYLITGCDLIFFGYLKMNAISYFKRGIPAFKRCYFHGLVTDKLGQKMSKSKGNVLNPEELIKVYGLDVMRLSILEASDQSKKIAFDPDSIKVKKLLNKIFSIGNFFDKFDDEALNISQEASLGKEIGFHYLSFSRDFKHSFLNLKIDKVFEIIYRYFFHFSASYLEMIKQFGNKKVLDQAKYCFFLSFRLISFLTPETGSKLIAGKTFKVPSLVGEASEEEVGFCNKLNFIFEALECKKEVKLKINKEDKILIRISEKDKEKGRPLFLIENEE